MQCHPNCQLASPAFREGTPTTTAPTTETSAPTPDEETQEIPNVASVEIDSPAENTAETNPKPIEGNHNELES